MIELFTTGSPAHYLGILVTLLAATLGSIHALLHKRDPRSAVLWLGIIWLVPLVGVCLYLLLGVNRIRRRALSLRAGLEPVRSRNSTHEYTLEQIESMLPVQHQYLHVLAASGTRIIERPLVSGNQITLLQNGDEAYPAMLDAIRKARTSIALSSYIFDSDAVGMEFVKALAEAVGRGVAVRVLVDATGTWYSWPPIQRALLDSQVPYARFLPSFSLWRLPSINLRNHRKLLVVDGQTGFTGGMNIREGHWLSRNPPHPVQDLHFRVVGPVVSHLQEVFAEDWRFTTGETLEGPAWFPSIDSSGSVISRGVADGPDEDVDPMRWTFLAAISAAKSSIRIATPYFLPDPPLISALNLAAMRGVRVQVLL
ncbi:MAG: cardiolipin synthase, partial [Verrucomicrobia bacterium]|nr:cardiolipin synthase [Verrucomicrobiota bacterium]